MKRATLVTLTLVLIFALTACDSGDSPEKAAQEWLEALANFDGLRMDTRTCSEQKKQLQEGGLLLTTFGTLGQEMTGQNVTIDVSEVNIAPGNNTGNVATVKVNGLIRASIGLLVQSQEIDDTWKMMKEEGKWKYCGLDLFTSADLPLLVLQPSDSPLPLHFSSNNPADLLDRSEFRENEQLRADIQSFSTRSYGDDNTQKYIWSDAVLFKTSGSAKDNFEAIVAGTSIISENYQQKIDTKELGDQSIGYKFVGVGDEENDAIYFYAWRTKNVIMILRTLAPTEAFSQSDVQSLVDNIQSQLKAAEGLPQGDAVGNPSDSIRDFSAQELKDIVLQPDEVPLEEMWSDYSSDFLNETEKVSSNFGPKEIEQFQLYNLQAFAGREFENISREDDEDFITVVSLALLCSNAKDASRLLQLQAEEYYNAFTGVIGQKDMNTDGLGDESLGYSQTHEGIEVAYFYFWRINNLDLILFVVDTTRTTFREVDARALAELMQSHILTVR